MKEHIGNVTLNYEFYKGEDAYSDGDIEDTLLEIAKTCKNTQEVYQQLMKSNEWAVLYHFSPIRHNLLEWYGFDKEGSLLEIGAGCGAMTGLFCRQQKKVTALELSKKRSQINAYRNRECGNLEIVVGNFEDIALTEKFDYVSLIGVLEYAVSYIHSNSPFLDLLKRAGNCLKPHGTVFVAIENKYGLKYWAGAPEDHTGEAFRGIEGYQQQDRVRTFSRDGLSALLSAAGFGRIEFYYPIPDYKMPLEIYTEHYLPRKGSVSNPSPAYDRERLALFDEVRVFDSLCEDGMFEQFANSFLVIAKKS